MKIPHAVRHSGHRNPPQATSGLASKSATVRWGTLLLCLLWPFTGNHPSFLPYGQGATAQAHPAILTAFDTAQVETTLDSIARIAEAEATQKAIREALQALDKQIDSARNARELEVVSCLVEQRAKLRALLRVVTTATVLLRESLDRLDPKEATIEYRRVLVAQEHFKRLMHDAARCAEPSGIPVTPTGDAVTLVLERPLTGEDAISDPIETILNPDLGTIPCW